jgi:hypothetical protein
MEQRPYANTVGFLIEADCKQDISDATSLSFRVRKPVSGTEVTWSESDGVMTFAIDGVTRGLKYTTKAGDLNEPGTYKVHAYLTLGDWTGPGEVGTLAVRELFS